MDEFEGERKVKVTWDKRLFLAVSAAYVQFMFGKNIFSL